MDKKRFILTRVLPIAAIPTIAITSLSISLNNTQEKYERTKEELIASEGFNDVYLVNIDKLKEELEQAKAEIEEANETIEDLNAKIERLEAQKLKENTSTPEYQGSSEFYNYVDGYEDEMPINASCNNILVFDKKKAGEITFLPDYRDYYLLSLYRVDDKAKEILGTDIVYYSIFDHLPGDYDNKVYFMGCIDSRGVAHAITYDSSVDVNSLTLLEDLKKSTVPVECYSSINGFLSSMNLDELILPEYTSADLELINRTINPTPERKR